MKAFFVSNRIRWELETYEDGSEVRVEGGAELNPELGEDRIVRAETEFLVEVRRLALWKRRNWTTVASFSVRIRDASGVRFSRTWREPLLKVERKFEEDSRCLGTALTSKRHLVETRFWDRTSEYKEALRQTLRGDRGAGRARCEDSLVEAAERLAGVRDLIRRCAQEGVRGISDLEVANLAFAASEEKKLRDSWWTVTSEESEGEGGDEDSSEEEGGTEEEKSSGSNRDSGEEGESDSGTDEYLATNKSVREELLTITRKVRVQLAVASTMQVEGPAKEEVQATRITMEELSANFFSGEEAKKFYVLGSGQLQAVVSGKKMRALVDNGSESTVCRDSIARELGLEIDRGVSMSMVVADNKLQPAEGVCHSPVIEVAGVEATVPIFSVKECSSELILGRTWLSAVHATTLDLPDESQTLSIQSPDGIIVVLKTVDAQDERNRTSLTRRKGAQSRVCRVRLEEVPLTDRGPKEDQMEIEDVGDRIVINDMGYEKEDEEEEFGGCVNLSFLEGSP
ncbi:hypothetical protein CBR_g31555 [Chara braunii]|uniref:Peptidase A2 domain-containing protein n=1 Tax=Chara braunii TaxID=69332 RepID=A0A388LFB4_CHABU|nr:hypothetical protein CBR_g31555 [Chara braunii]|eukprot:GBG80999.1 hypothetical protein CBR_g31555 [Chara braunii]